QRWRDSSAEFLARLALDHDLLARDFGDGKSLVRLTAVNTGAGDAHRGGRSVVVPSFDSGMKLVYQTRSLALDAHSRELAERLNGAGKVPPLARLRVFARGTHGWSEFVAAGPCRTLDEVRAFYRRQGSWLALLHALGATDSHYENLIAAGEHP